MKQHRRVLSLAVVLAASAAVSACTTSPGAAALVGSDRISTAALQTEVDAALADPAARQQLGPDRAGFTRTELARLINNELVARAAAAHGVTASATDIDQQLASFQQQAGSPAALDQQASAGGVPVKELRSFVDFYVLQQKLADRLIAGIPVTQAQLAAAYQKNIAQFDTVHAAHILVTKKALADSILADVKAHPSNFAADAAKYSIDTSNAKSGGDLGSQPQSAFVKAFADPVFAAKAGSFLEVHSQFGWHVVHVISHVKVSLAAATPQLKASILSTQRDKLLQQALTAEAKKLGVHVNPRFGRWDAVSGQVVAPKPDDGVSSPSPSAAS